MAQIVNLNRHRKARARAEARAQADANAVKFGQTRAERDAIAARAEQAARLLDGHRRSDDTPDQD
jgi:hypothetical protein